MGQNRESHTHGADGSSVQVRNSVFHGIVVCQVAGFKIIEAIDEQIDTLGMAFDIVVVEIIDNRGDFHLRIAERNLAFCRFSLGDGITNIAFIKQNLPLQIEVIDDGPGLPDDIAGMVFEPFVSGRENGTGLGLALVSKIITDHGGWVSVDSIPGRTAFRISLPRVSTKKRS